ncbi:2-oxoglutarate dehydrogenase complex dihydrolipoyllysine-residue succinyltransferase [Kaarinaea lacus]
MLVEVKVPVLAESVSEATLVTWNKHAGEYVERNENLVDMETDKVMLEIVAPNAGVLKEIVKGDGATVSSNDVIAVIDTDAAQAKSADTTAEPAPSATVSNIREASAGKTAAATKPAAVSSVPTADMNLSPAVRKLVADHQLDPHLIKGSGKHGRIVKGDVLEYLEHIQPEPAEEEEHVTETLVPVKGVPAPAPAVGEEERLEKRVPMSRLRQRIAERLKEAQNTAAILTTFNEVNMKPVMDLRSRYKDKFLERHKVKLGFMSFFTKAVVEALKQFPVINATTDGNDIIYHGYYDIGIAVGTPRGLVVPILRNVDSMSFADVELAIQDYGTRAKEGRLSLEELTGGTFSISNGGVYGSMLSTPILNPPQSAILGMHNIVERPMVENGEIVIRPMMYLALSYDHRIIDGHDAVLFLVTVKQLIEDPTRILLDL